MILEGQIFVACGHFRDIDAAKAGLVVFKDGGENQTLFDDRQLYAFQDFEKKCPHRNQFSHGHAECAVFGSGGAQSDVGL